MDANKNEKQKMGQVDRRGSDFQQSRAIVLNRSFQPELNRPKAN